MYYVYIIRSLQDGQLYTGSTGDRKKRIEEYKDAKYRVQDIGNLLNWFII